MQDEEKRFCIENVKVEEAAWAAVAEDGRQAVAECFLMEDDESDWGWSFYFSGYFYDPQKQEWIERDGGCFWGYQNADDPELAFEAQCACGSWFDPDDFHRIDYNLLSEVGVNVCFKEGYHARPFTRDEIEHSFEGNAGPAPCAEGCDLDCEHDDARDASGAMGGARDEAQPDRNAER